jgi:hypothetical protein
MNWCKCLGFATTFLMLGGMPAGATASGPASASQGSISISITIPAHYQIGARREKPADVSLTSDHALCVETNGNLSYQIAVIDEHGVANQLAIPPSIGDVCTPATPPLATNPVSLARDRSHSQPGPVTVLIVPD